jgi:hypothetical protein
MVGTENIIKKISEKKRQAMLAEYEEVKWKMGVKLNSHFLYIFYLIT